MKITAAITGIGGYLPDYILTNDELSRMVDTNDQWIVEHTGIRERHILKGDAMGVSEMGAKAVARLLENTHTPPGAIDLLICPTVTADMAFPSTSCIICGKTGITSAFAFDINAGCSGFLYGLTIAKNFIENGACKKVIVVANEKMSSLVDYTDRKTCPLFGDGAAAALVEPDRDGLGIQDIALYADGIGKQYLYQKAGGSMYPPTEETVRNHEHFIRQDGPNVYKHAVTNMSAAIETIMQRNRLTGETVDYFISHQANLRIIDSVRNRMELDAKKVLINIDKRGNTSAASVPLVLWDFEKRFKKGDNIIIATFGAGFTWGAMYYKWAYESSLNFEC
ncbi:MAG: ketoacyl-ACP synthase III [Prevotellaceae bacterium]|jgi:3-oxoacyl-[acyl-carrier-protein] synthase-3|nr:ketoacyl-ACP synthase III [Prevotellaceae bacterium]